MSRGRYYSLLLHAFFVQVNCGKTQILNDETNFVFSGNVLSCLKCFDIRRVSMELYKNTSGMFGPKWEHEFVWGGGGVFPLQFRVLPNFHKCFYLTIRQRDGAELNIVHIYRKYLYINIYRKHLYINIYRRYLYINIYRKYLYINIYRKYLYWYLYWYL